MRIRLVIFALIDLFSAGWLALLLLYVGLSLSLIATWMYIRRGYQELKQLSSSD